jgi:uncharacterized protein
MDNILENVKKEILILNDKYLEEADDNFNFWEEHIKYVVYEANILAEKYNADKEIVELAALLHYIALIKKEVSRVDHHIVGADIAEIILRKYNYPDNRIARVKYCILNHRSSKNGTTIEELCVADADILAHFDNIPMIFNSAFNRNDVSLSDVKGWIKTCFEKDYNDLSSRVKKDFADKYKLICEIILGE